MMRPPTTTRRVLVLPLLSTVLLLGACGSSSEPEFVTYAASSSVGADIEVTYQGEDGEITEIVASPWSLEVEESGSFGANLEVRNTGLEGEVACKVSSTAFPPVGTGGEAAALCFARVTKQGGTRTVSTSSDFELFVRNADGEPIELPADLPEPQRAEVGSRTYLDGEVLLGGHKGVYLLDSTSGIVEEVEGSRDFGNPVEAARGDDGTVYAVDIFKDLLQAISPGSAEVETVAEWPDESPNGVWVVDGQLLVLLSGPDALLALDADGTEQWRHEFGEPVSKLEVESLGDGRMIVGSRDMSLVALDVETGAVSVEVPVTAELTEIIRRDDLVFFSFNDADGGGFTEAVSIDGLGSDAQESFEMVGSRVVFDPDGVPYGGGGGVVSRLDPATFEVDRSIDLPDMTLLAAGNDVLYMSEKIRAGSDDVMINAIPTSLFD